MGNMAIGKTRKTLLASLLVGFGIIFGGTAATAGAATWTVNQLTLPAEYSQSELLGIDCFSATACTAVGRDGIPGGVGGAFAETFNGTTWTFASEAKRNPSGAKNGVLRGASCVAATTCMTVGSYGISGAPKAWAQLQTGTSWKTFEIPNPSGSSQAELNDVSCLLTTEVPAKTWCMAVGYKMISGDDKPFTMRYDGSSWGEVSNTTEPNATLKSVSCTSIEFCLAVGATQNHPLDETWEGIGPWTAPAEQPPVSGENPVLNGLDCFLESTKQWCMAVGKSQRTEGLRALGPTRAWNATKYMWYSGSAPTLAGSTSVIADGVSCILRTECWAVGEGSSGSTKRPWASLWNDNGWLEPGTIPIATGASGAQLHEISCVAKLSCVAVGWSLFGSTPKSVVYNVSP